MLGLIFQKNPKRLIILRHNSEIPTIFVDPELAVMDAYTKTRGQVRQFKDITCSLEASGFIIYDVPEGNKQESYHFNYQVSEHGLLQSVSMVIKTTKNYKRDEDW